MSDWKDFLLKNKWMPVAHLRQRFGLKKHDIDNFRARQHVKAVLAPWRVSTNQPPERLREIFTQAWKYYLEAVCEISLEGPPSTWVPGLLRLRNISRSSAADFRFLADSRFLRAAYPEEYEEYISRGFTSIAFALFHFWPGRDRLVNAGVLPFMFHHTHRAALEHIDIESMVEHVYLRFHAGLSAAPTSEELDDAKTRFYARHTEQAFLTKSELDLFAIPPEFYSDVGLRSVKERIASRYARDLGYEKVEDEIWSANVFRQRHPEFAHDVCEYCGLAPIDLHHLLPRSEYPELIYDDENVSALCLQVHALITRKRWTPEEEREYKAAINEWKNAPAESRKSTFEGVMQKLHDSIYGRDFVRFTEAQSPGSPDS